MFTLQCILDSFLQAYKKVLKLVIMYIVSLLLCFDHMADCEDVSFPVGKKLTLTYWEKIS